MPNKKKSTDDETLLGIDFGKTNIGIAFGRGTFAQPLKNISGINQQEAIKEISRFAIENKVEKIIMGLPLTADNKETQMSLETRKFAKLLKIYLKKPVIFVNEYRTTKSALERSINMGVSQKNRQNIDHISAALILKNYFDNS